MAFENIPEDIKNSIIEPLLEIESTDWESMKKSFNDFIEGTIIPQIEKYIGIIEKNLEWFLDLEEKRNFEMYLYEKDSSTSKIYFREYNNLVNFLIRKFFEKIDPERLGLIEKLNDIYLESDQRRGYYYNIKFYHYNESILELKEKIKRIVSKALRLETLERKHDLGLNLPRWSSFNYSLESGTFFNIDFIENILEVNHNNIYFSTIFFKDKKRVNFWEEAPPNLIMLSKNILKRICEIKTLMLVNMFNISNDLASEIEKFAERKITTDEKERYDILGEGESSTIEYKESYRWDVKNQTKNKILKQEVSKAVCAFLNAQGGKVLIGINDDGEINGIEPDLKLFGGTTKEKSKDLFSQDIKKTLKDNIDAITIRLTDSFYHRLGNHEIMEIRVKPSTKPVFHLNEDFIVRNGNASIKLEGKDFFDYLIDRFNDGPLENYFLKDGYDEENEEYIEREYQARTPNVSLINEYIEFLKNPQISDDLFSRRLDTIYSEFEVLRLIDWNLHDYDCQEALDTVKNFLDFALDFLNKEIGNNMKRSLLNIIYLIIHEHTLKEIIEESYFNELSDLYEKGLSERTLINILIEMGYFEDKLKSILIKGAEEEDTELLNNFSSVQLKPINADNMSIIRELHNISNQKLKEEKKDLANAIERVIRNLEK